MNYKGVVQKIHKQKMYGVLMDDEQWYGHGSDQPKFNEGDLIEFEYDENQKGTRVYKNIIPKSVQVISASNGDKGVESGGSSRQSGSAPKQGKTMTKDNYWENKAAEDIKTQKAIRYQASRNSAIEVVDLLLKNECVSLGNAKQKKAGIVEELVEHYTNEYYNKTLEVQDTDGPIGEEGPQSASVRNMDEGGDFE